MKLEISRINLLSLNNCSQFINFCVCSKFYFIVPASARLNDRVNLTVFRLAVKQDHVEMSLTKIFLSSEAVLFVKLPWVDDVTVFLGNPLFTSVSDLFRYLSRVLSRGFCRFVRTSGWKIAMSRVRINGRPYRNIDWREACIKQRSFYITNKSKRNVHLSDSHQYRTVYLHFKTKLFLFSVNRMNLIIILIASREHF